jgi:hypothetical protein
MLLLYWNVNMSTGSWIAIGDGGQTGMGGGGGGGDMDIIGGGGGG